MHLWISAIGATTCCLIIGAILMDPGRLTPEGDAVVRFSSYAPPAPAAGKSAPAGPLAGIAERAERVRQDPVVASPADRRSRRKGVESVSSFRKALPHSA